MLPMLIILGFVIGMLADPIKNFSSINAHLVLAVMIALVLPLWLLLVGNLEKLFSGGQTWRLRIKICWIAWLFLGIFAGRFFQMISTEMAFGGSIILASPFLGVFAGIMLFRLVRGRS